MGFDEMDVDQIWMDGEFVDWEDAQVHVLTHALHYGTGIFEGVRCYDTEKGPAIFRWDEHLERLYQSAKPYELDIGFDPEEITEATLELIRREGLQSCYVRPLVYYGYESLGVSPGECPTRTAIAVWPWGAYLGEDALENGIKAKVSSWRKHASSQIPTTAKTTGPYINSMLATEEAKKHGYTEAIVLNKEGYVAEGPGENIFLVRDDELYTPAVSQSILEGITRETIIELAREQGYTVHEEATLSRGELYTADELFFVGSAAEVTPIAQVDNVEVHPDGRGPITEEIQSRFFDILHRRTDDHEEWFTYVD